MEVLVNFNKSSLPKPILDKLHKIISNPEFHPEVAKRASEAAKGMCLWVRALAYYHKVLREIRPKEAALEDARKRFDELSK